MIQIAHKPSSKYFSLFLVALRWVQIIHHTHSNNFSRQIEVLSVIHQSYSVFFNKSESPSGANKPNPEYPM